MVLFSPVQTRSASGSCWLIVLLPCCLAVLLSCTALRCLSPLVQVYSDLEESNLFLIQVGQPELEGAGCCLNSGRFELAVQLMPGKVQITWQGS